MKSMLVAGIVLMFAVPVAYGDEPQREPKPRFKGVELYSWKDNKNGWQFALLDGTNRLKTEKEVKTAPTIYSGIDKLSEAFHRLAVGEMVFWSHPIEGFVFPPEADLKAIDAAAKAAKIKLERFSR